MNFDFSVVVPLFNEEENVGRLIDSLTESLERNRFVADYELVCVDDGSADNTLEKLRSFATAQTVVVSLPHNSGQSGALTAGMKASKFSLLGLIDGDLQTSPEDFEILLAALDDNCDMVTGVRVDRQDTLIKRIASRVANGFRRRVLGDSFRDIGCPLKVLRRECVMEIPLFDSFHRYLPHLVQMQGYRVREVPVRHFPRLAGETKYGVWDRTWIGLQSLYVVRWLGRHYIGRVSQD